MFPCFRLENDGGKGQQLGFKDSWNHMQFTCTSMFVGVIFAVLELLAFSSKLGLLLQIQSCYLTFACISFLP